MTTYKAYMIQMFGAKKQKKIIPITDTPFIAQLAHSLLHNFTFCPPEFACFMVLMVENRVLSKLYSS